MKYEYNAFVYYLILMSSVDTLFVFYIFYYIQYNNKLSYLIILFYFHRDKYYLI